MEVADICSHLSIFDNEITRDSEVKKSSFKNRAITSDTFDRNFNRYTVHI